MVCHLDVHPNALVLVVILCCLFATIDPQPEYEEGYEGDTFAGGDQEDPGTTGKPPLALAFLYTYIACICFGFENCIILMTYLPVALRHFYFTTPVGAALV